MKPRPRLRYPGGPEAPTRTSPSEEDKLLARMETKLSPAEEVWTTQDGRRVRIQDMNDHHLSSVIVWLSAQEPRKHSGMMKMLASLEAMQREWVRRHGKRLENG